MKITHIKIRKDGGLNSTYLIEKLVEGSEPLIIEQTTKSPISYSADLSKLLDKIKIHVIRICNLFGLGDKPVKSLGVDGQKKLLEFMNEEIEITGLTITRDNQHEATGVLITAKLGTLVKKDVALNTPLVKFESDEYKFMDDLRSEVQDIENQTEFYLQNSVGTIQLELQLS